MWILFYFIGLCRFPLYTRGVDTYRFEYAVFLLNKDIELVRFSDLVASCWDRLGY